MSKKMGTGEFTPTLKLVDYQKSLTIVSGSVLALVSQAFQGAKSSIENVLAIIDQISQMKVNIPKHILQCIYTDILFNYFVLYIALS